MKENNNNKAIWILSSIIIVLVLIGLYFFVVQPQKVNYDDNRRIEGIDYAVSSILQGIQAQGYTQLPISENQSVILAYVTPEELEALNAYRQQVAQAESQ